MLFLAKKIKSQTKKYDFTASNVSYILQLGDRFEIKVSNILHKFLFGFVEISTVSLQIFLLQFNAILFSKLTKISFMGMFSFVKNGQRIILLIFKLQTDCSISVSIRAGRSLYNRFYSLDTGVQAHLRGSIPTQPSESESTAIASTESYFPNRL